MIEGRTINFRALEEEDLNQLKVWRNSHLVQHTAREYRQLNTVNQKQWFDSLHQSYPPKDLMFGITSKAGKLIGVCGLTYINWKNRSAEVSIYVGEKDWQGKGVGKEALALLIEYGFKEIGLHRIWAEIYEFNESSIKLFENVGFRREGTCRDSLWRDGRWHGSHMYSILEREFLNH